MLTCVRVLIFWLRDERLVQASESYFERCQLLAQFSFIRAFVLPQNSASSSFFSLTVERRFHSSVSRWGLPDDSSFSLFRSVHCTATIDGHRKWAWCCACPKYIQRWRAYPASRTFSSCAHMLCLVIARFRAKAFLPWWLRHDAVAFWSNAVCSNAPYAHVSSLWMHIQAFSISQSFLSSFISFWPT